jgi:phage tail-like protein
MDAIRSPYPIGTLLPAVYQEDPFAMRFTAGFDDVLAPIISTLDCLAAYVDPMLCPSDFLEWLAGWVGVTLDENCSVDRQRAVVADAAELYRQRGAGLRAQLELLTGGRVDVADNGGVAFSTTPGAALPGEDTPRLAVRVCLPEPTAVESSLDSVITACKPAHVVHQLEVVRE